MYPTVSNQPTLSATKDKTPELGAVARQQAQRFSGRCQSVRVRRDGSAVRLTSTIRGC